MPSQETMEYELFKLIHENQDDKNKAKIVQATRQTWPERIHIHEFWSFAPGDIIGAMSGVPSSRVHLGRIYVGDRPSAHFLCLTGKERIEKVPYFAVHNSLKNDNYELRQCCMDLSKRYDGDFYIQTKPLVGVNHFIMRRKEELKASCDHVFKASVLAAGDKIMKTEAEKDAFRQIIDNLILP